jgi:hypothetical protein
LPRRTHVIVEPKTTLMLPRNFNVVDVSLELDPNDFVPAKRGLCADSWIHAYAGMRGPKNAAAQNSPTIRPSGPMSIAFADGTFGSPGMVMISPQIATTNSAPAESRTSRTLMT